MKSRKGECRASDSKDRIIIFAKQPNAGEVKTRLIPAIGAQQATQLHALMTRQIVAIACASNTCPVELWCSPSPEHALFQRLAEQYPLSLRTQIGCDLGERMYNAFSAALVGNHHSNVDNSIDNDTANAITNNAAIIVGSDCPSITPRHFRDAFAALNQGNNTASLVPALDGGYVLLGLRQLDRQLFEGVPWGTEYVLRTTRTRLQSLNWAWQEFTALSDIDTQQDLMVLADTTEKHRLGSELNAFLQRL
ncbi:MAG: glycosyltransferase [Gammaproteobacteria bacterium]|nr:glycosyltransferase [Gammaproteobacteria bacterium]